MMRAFRVLRIFGRLKVFFPPFSSFSFFFWLSIIGDNFPNDACLPRSANLWAPQGLSPLFFSFFVSPYPNVAQDDAFDARLSPLLPLFN
jgi:hypothetical protein